MSNFTYIKLLFLVVVTFASCARKQLDVKQQFLDIYSNSYSIPCPVKSFSETEDSEWIKYYWD